jgi:hemerythrin-like domain-containing protein
MPDALQLLREQHRQMQDLFRQFEQSDDRRKKRDIVQRAMKQLDVHAEIEEELFYPAVRQGWQEHGMVNEAEEEHHAAKLLIAELRSMKPDDARFEAKFTVLAESVKHHIQEEEREMLPLAAEAGQERMGQLGQQMQRRTEELMQDMEKPQRKARTTARRRTTASASGGGTRSRSTGTRASTTRRTTRAAAGTSRARAGSTTTRSRAGARSPA